MKLLLMSVFIMTTGIMHAQNTQLANKIIAQEKAALERWNNGDPSGYLAITANDNTYFDPFLNLRLDGKAEIEKLYASIKGQVNVESYEMVNPQVQIAGEIAVLTFNLNSTSHGKVQKWNSTEVYRLEADGSWKIIHSHWSLTMPSLK
jgi:ketosteroid isomerase-like protein